MIIGSLGAAQSLYLAVYSLLDRKRNFKNLLLGLFFFSITLRIVKSLFWVYLSTTPNWFLNLGFVAHSAFGPLLLLYAYHFIHDKKWSNLQLLNFLPSVLLLVFMFRLNGENFWYLGGYSALLWHQMGYGVLSIALLGRTFLKPKAFPLKRKDWVWLAILVVGTMAFQLSYFANYVLGLTPYLLGPIVYGVFIYFSSFFLIKNPQLLKRLYGPKKYRNINLSKTELKTKTESILHVMATEKPYLDSDFSIKQLAEKTKCPVYVLSFVINTSFSKHFSDFINSYRIKEAKFKLLHPDYQYLKIASIAFECGFNSLSSFNIAFKKHTGVTPSEFKKNPSDL